MVKAQIELAASDVIAICSLVIAFFSFAITIWQGWVLRRHNRLSVKPLLDFNRNVRPDKILISLKNHGVGVAVINSIHITNNEETDYFGRDSLEGLAKKYSTGDLYYEFIQAEPGTALAAGDEVRLLMVNLQNASAEERKALAYMLGESRIHVKYESIYGEKDGATCIMDVPSMHSKLPS